MRKKKTLGALCLSETNIQDKENELGKNRETKKKKKKKKTLSLINKIHS